MTKTNAKAALRALPRPAVGWKPPKTLATQAERRRKPAQDPLGFWAVYRDEMI